MRSIMGSWGAPPPVELVESWGVSAAHSTLLHALQAAVEQRPDHLALRVIRAGGGAMERTYAGLEADVRRAAGGLLGMGLTRGDRMVICAPSSVGTIALYLGALSLGILPFFVKAPRSAESAVAWQQVHDLADRVRACAVCVQSFPEQIPAGRDYVRLDQIAAGPGLEGLGPLPRAEDAAHLRLTSGANGEPRIAAVGHRQMATKVRAVGAALGVRPHDHLYSWLPLDHDMGLIALSCALYWQRPITLTDPRTFARDPVGYWLQTMSRYHCTMTAAPSSAYVACARLAARRSFDQLDLSRCRVAIWASEAVPPGAVDAFARAFARYGYRASSTWPCERLGVPTSNRPPSPESSIGGVGPELPAPSGRASRRPLDLQPTAED